MGLYFEVPKPTHTFRNPTPSWSESEGLEEPRKRAVAEPNVAKEKKQQWREVIDPLFASAI